MAGQYQLPGGTLTVTQPDPEEVALRRAQIAKLLQETSSGQAQTAFQQKELQQRGQIAAGQLGLGTGQLNLDQQKLAATLPIEQGKLTVDQQRLVDENRYRTGSLAEETRFHNVTAGNEVARVKAGLVGDTLTHVLPGELSGQIPKGTVEAMLTASGFPELASNMKSVSDRATIAKAIAFADQYKTLDEKKFGAAAAGLPPGTEDTFRNAAWNRYKSSRPDIFGKDVAAAAETALQPPAPTTAAAPTTGSALTSAYVAPGAGSPSVGWATGPDSPLASTTPGVSEFGPKNPQMGLVDPTTSDVLPLPGGTIARTGAAAPVNDIVKAAATPAVAAAPQVAPVVAGTPAPTGTPFASLPTPTPAPMTTPAPVIAGSQLPPPIPLPTEEVERRRRALALQSAGR